MSALSVILVIGGWFASGAVIGGGFNALSQFLMTGSVRWTGLGGVFDAAAEMAPLGPFAGLAGRSSTAEGAAISGAAAAGAAKETVTVQRWMSQAELKATQESGLRRGGRDGTHYVTDAANADPLRARQRLALPQTPQLRATMQVPKDALSAPSKVEPAFNMPGGGKERTATGNVPAEVTGVD